MKRRQFIQLLSAAAASSLFSQHLLAAFSQVSGSEQEKILEYFSADFGKQIFDSKLWPETSMDELKLDELNIDFGSFRESVLELIEQDFAADRFIYLPFEIQGRPMGEYSLSFVEVRLHLFGFFGLWITTDQ